MGNVMGCCQTKAARGVNGKLKLDGVDDDAEPEVMDAPKKEITPEHLLLSAALAGDTSTVQTLINSGISVNSKGDKDYTALHNATRNGHTALVEMLVAHKADVNAKTNAQNTPLHLAAIFGHAGAGEALVKGGAELMARNNVGIMPLHAASLGGAAPPQTPSGHAAMGKLLLDKGATIDTKDTYWTALHNGARGGHADFVDLLLERGANPNLSGLEGNTPLHHSALEGHLKVTRALLQKGGDVNVPNDHKLTPLHMAFMGGHHEVVKLLMPSANEETMKQFNMGRSKADVEDASATPV
ncbi:ankyrin repeat-containing domain protein [Baffinella frigidus]|nr:ankyrin repeat-containing domain protein [Cryptophyta sp. CCMP2293]